MYIIVNLPQKYSMLNFQDFSSEKLLDQKLRKVPFKSLPHSFPQQNFIKE